MARLLRTGAATEDLVALFTEAAERPQLLARRRAAFAKTFGLSPPTRASASRRLPSHPDVRVFP
jgi:hypothetical protein